MCNVSSSDIRCCIMYVPFISVIIVKLQRSCLFFKMIKIKMTPFYQVLLWGHQVNNSANWKHGSETQKHILIRISKRRWRWRNSTAHLKKTKTDTKQQIRSKSQQSEHLIESVSVSISSSCTRSDTEQELEDQRGQLHVQLVLSSLSRTDHV